VLPEEPLRAIRFLLECVQMTHAQTKIKAKKIEKIKKEYYDFIRSFKERVIKQVSGR